jgi:hypothetical protein
MLHQEEAEVGSRPVSGGDCQKHFLDPGTKKPRRFLGGAASFVWVVSELGRSVLIGQQGTVVARAKTLVAKGGMIQCQLRLKDHLLVIQQIAASVKQSLFPSKGPHTG